MNQTTGLAIKEDHRYNDLSQLTPKINGPRRKPVAVFS